MGMAALLSKYNSSLKWRNDTQQTPERTVDTRRNTGMSRRHEGRRLGAACCDGREGGRPRHVPFGWYGRRLKFVVLLAGTEHAPIGRAERGARATVLAPTARSRRAAASAVRLCGAVRSSVAATPTATATATTTPDTLPVRQVGHGWRRRALRGGRAWAGGWLGGWVRLNILFVVAR